MQNYQHPNIPELFARIDKDGSYSVFLRGEKALEEVSKEDLKHMGFHIEEDRSHKIVMPIGTAGEDIKTGQCVQVCDRGIVMKYRHGKQVEQEEKRDRIDNLYKEFFECFKQVYIMGNREYIGTCKESEDGMQKKFVELVEKHMPKQKKFSKNDVIRRIQANYPIYINDMIIRNFLRDHDLLEE